MTRPTPETVGMEEPIVTYIDALNEYATRLEAELESLRDPWRPISEAPKDGKLFLVCLPRMMNLVLRCCYNRVHKYYETDLNVEGVTKPTFFHKGDLWQPIVYPPKGE